MTFPRTRYQSIADRLSHEAEQSVEVSVYISPDAIAEALGDKGYNPSVSVLATLRKFIEFRRMIGHEPTATDILDWIEENDDA